VQPPFNPHRNTGAKHGPPRCRCGVLGTASGRHILGPRSGSGGRASRRGSARGVRGTIAAPARPAAPCASWSRRQEGVGVQPGSRQLGPDSRSHTPRFPCSGMGREWENGGAPGLRYRQYNKAAKEILTTTATIMNMQNKLYTTQFFLTP